jgi:dynein heavy chain
VFQVREAEIRIDATIGPVEESFALLNKHQLSFSDGSAERVDGLSYGWKNLNALVHKHPKHKAYHGEIHR